MWRKNVIASIEDEWILVVEPGSVELIQIALEIKGIEVTLQEACYLWRKVSEASHANFLHIPTSPTEMYSMLAIAYDVDNDKLI